MVKLVTHRTHACSDEGFKFQDVLGLSGFEDPKRSASTWLTHMKVDPLHTYDTAGVPRLSRAEGPFLPRWQTSPVLQSSMVNENRFEQPEVASFAKDCIATKTAILGGFVTPPPGPASSPNMSTSFFATLLSMREGVQVEYLGDPMSHLFVPIFETLNGTDRNVAAVLTSTIHWRWYLRHVLPKSNNGINVVIENECDGNFTYFLDGEEAYVVGFGDQHDPKFTKYHYGGNFTAKTIEDGTAHGITIDRNVCPYSFHVYASQEDYSGYVTNEPVIICLSVAAVFFFTIIMFFTYDALVSACQFNEFSVLELCSWLILIFILSIGRAQTAVGPCQGYPVYSAGLISLPKAIP